MWYDEYGRPRGRFSALQIGLALATLAATVYFGVRYYKSRTVKKTPTASTPATTEKPWWQFWNHPNVATAYEDVLNTPAQAMAFGEGGY